MKMPALALLVGALVALPSLSAEAHSDGPTFAALVESEDFGFVHAGGPRRNDASRGHAQPPEWIGRPWEDDRDGRTDFWHHGGHDGWHEHHTHRPPVPEPAGAATFAAGLALVALLKRRPR